MRTRLLMFVVVVLAMFAAPLYGQAIATSGQGFAWDYSDAAIAAGVVRFELQLDGGTWTSVGLATVVETRATDKTYRVAMPALTPGPHTAAVRACNVDVCSEPTSLLSFKLVVVPETPGNLRIQ